MLTENDSGTADTVVENPNDQGKFAQLLKRNNKQLREDRAEQIITSTRTKYRRLIEDIQERLDQLVIDRINGLDINPTNTTTIIQPSDFDPVAFVKADVDLCMKRRAIKIELEEALAGYEELFGKFKKAD